jgi:hypothetical protein
MRSAAPLEPRFLGDLRDAGGAAVADLLLRAAGETDDRDAIEALAAAAYARSWERLHFGSWKTVANVWREAFGVASVLQAQCLLHSQQFVECLATLDLVRASLHLEMVSREQATSPAGAA